MSGLTRLAKTLFRKPFDETDFDIVQTQELPDFRPNIGITTVTCFYFARRDPDGTYGLFRAEDDYRPHTGQHNYLFRASIHGDNVMDGKSVRRIDSGLTLGEALDRLDAEESELYAALPAGFMSDKVSFLPGQHTSDVRKRLGIPGDDASAPRALKAARQLGM